MAEFCSRRTGAADKQRVLEGTAWPVYRVGMPGSLHTVVQFLGRAMRLKGTDYPAEPRSGCPAQPRVAQRTLGNEPAQQPPTREAVLQLLTAKKTQLAH